MFEFMTPEERDGVKRARTRDVLNAVVLPMVEGPVGVRRSWRQGVSDQGFPFVEVNHKGATVTVTYFWDAPACGLWVEFADGREAFEATDLDDEFEAADLIESIVKGA